ncbi:MAG: type II secretion system protein, partial [Proteobacteria bacterium]|nr:type II secretion system protein [Pseudomonadota bacterium]
MRTNLTSLPIENQKSALAPFSGRQSGMSMIEIMVVVSLIGILMSFIVRNVMGAADNAKKDQ